MENKDIMVLDGTLSLKVQSITVGDEPIWSANTGRTSNGTMQGDIVAWKKTVQVTFGIMTDQEAVKFGRITHKPFYDLKFINPNTGKLDGIKCYAVPVQYPVYSYVTGFPRYVGVSCTFTER